MPLPSARLASINVGRAQRFEGDGGGKAFRSAILKGAVAGQVALGEEGVAGDVQADRRYHGGPDKAVYLYALEHLAFWQRALRCDPLPPGTLGENLTIEGWSDLEGTLHVGDTLAIGEGDAPAAIQLTTPRQPCWKLERRMGLPGFAKAFLESRRIGSYARVVRPGPIAAGDPIRVLTRSPNSATLRDLIDAWHFRDRAARTRVLADESLDPSLRRRLS
jgi:MOSC domain-containing protein YiiM